eukprot:276390_1
MDYISTPSNVYHPRNHHATYLRYIVALYIAIASSCQTRNTRNTIITLFVHSSLIRPLLSYRTRYINNIVCDQEKECINDNIICLENKNCTVLCSGHYSCVNTVITPPKNGFLSLTCGGYLSCDGQTVNASNNHNLNFICSGVSACTKRTIAQVAGPPNACIWGRDGPTNIGINGEYIFQGYFNDAPWYKKRFRTVNYVSTHYLFSVPDRYQYFEYVISKQQPSNSPPRYAECRTSYSNPWHCTYTWEVQDTFMLDDSDVYCQKAPCPEWECDAIITDIEYKECGDAFPVKIGSNAWSKISGNRFFYFNSYDFRWVCDTSGPDVPSDLSGAAYSQRGWVDTTKGNTVSILFAVPNQLQQIQCIQNPTASPTEPTNIPTLSPSQYPSQYTINPTAFPSLEPTMNPTIFPSQQTTNPTIFPTLEPTNVPTNLPTLSPSHPTMNPTMFPSQPTMNPSIFPTFAPTSSPRTDTTQEFEIIDTASSQSTHSTYLACIGWDVLLPVLGVIILVVVVSAISGYKYRQYRAVRTEESEDDVTDIEDDVTDI